MVTSKWMLFFLLLATAAAVFTPLVGLAWLMALIIVLLAFIFAVRRDAQAGFRIYQDWLNIINLYEHTVGKPVYINASNTFDSESGRFPAENYPAGWLSNALEVVNQEPQIKMFGWFLDDFPHDDQWDMFSLSDPRGLLVDAANEFDALLLTE